MLFSEDAALLEVMKRVYGADVTPADLAQLEHGLKEYSGQQARSSSHPGFARLAVVVWNQIAKAWNRSRRASKYCEKSPLSLMPHAPGPWEDKQVSEGVAELTKRLWRIREELLAREERLQRWMRHPP